MGFFSSVKSGVASGIDYVENQGKNLLPGSVAQIQNKKQFLKFVSQKTAEAFVKQDNDCVVTVGAQEDISVLCAGERRGTINNGNGWFAEGPVCRRCYENVLNIAKDSWQRERDQWAVGHDVKVRENSDQALGNFADALEGCASACKACDIRDVSQFTNIRAKQSCTISTQEMINWQDNVSGSLAQTLYSRSDTLSALTKAIGATNEDEAVVSIQRTVRNKIDQTIVNDMLTAINADQEIEFKGASVDSEGNGTGGKFVGISQKTVIESGAQALVENNRFSDILSDDQWKVFEQSYNSDTTLDNLGQAVVDTALGFTDIITSTVGAIMIGVVAILGAVVLVIIMLLIYRWKTGTI